MELDPENKDKQPKSVFNVPKNTVFNKLGPKIMIVSPCVELKLERFEKIDIKNDIKRF